MRALPKKIVRKVLSNDLIFKGLKKILTYGWMLQFQRELADREVQEVDQKSFINALFTEPVVRHGPFKGMRYPGYRSRSSSLWPKFLGSYEMELTPTFESLLSENDYTEVIDVGCAEGYYAVGLAMRLPNAIVYAYDIDAEARELTRKMAVLNNVADRVVIAKDCTPETLLNFKFRGKALIVSDTEGYEKDLFTDAVVEKLKGHDLVIETHDWVELTISQELEKLFKRTHRTKCIPSVGDNLKAKYYEFEELADADLLTRYRIFEEGRRYTDEWLIATS